MLGWSKKRPRLLDIESHLFISMKVGGLSIIYPLLPRSRRIRPPRLEELEKKAHVKLEPMEIEVKWEPDEDLIVNLSNMGIDLDAFKHEASRLARLRAEAATFENELLRAAYRLIPCEEDLEEDFIDQLVSSVSQHLRYAVREIREKHKIPEVLEITTSENLFLKFIQEASERPSTPALMEETAARLHAETWMQEPTPQPENNTKPAPPTARWISFSKLQEGPKCLSEFSQDWSEFNWAILLDLPRSAVPTKLITNSLDKWGAISVEEVGKRKKIPNHSILALTRTHYPTKYSSPIRPAPNHPYVERLLNHIKSAYIVITTREIYNMKGVKETMDKLKFRVVEVTMNEEERIALEKLKSLNLDSPYQQVTPRLKKPAVLLPGLLDKLQLLAKGYSLDELNIEELLQFLKNKNDEKMVAETIKAAVRDGEYEYPSLAISLGILGDGGREEQI